MSYTAPCNKVFNVPFVSSRVTIKDTFIGHFKSAYSSKDADDSIGSIVVGNHATISCDYEVLAALKALVRTGETPNEELANACRQLFKSILQSDTTYITTKKMLQCLSNETYELDELSKAIRCEVSK